MKRIFKMLSIITLFITASCAATMKKEHFDEQKGRIVAVNINFKYNGEPANLGKIGVCQVLFSDDQDKILDFRTKDKYYFFNEGDIKEINISSIQCQNYRVLYNKCRLHTMSDVEKNIFRQEEISGAKTNIIYGGSVDVDWTPETFKISDLFYLGHLGIEDEGSFSIKKNVSGYKDFLGFMKKEFDKDPSTISNGALSKVE